MGQLNTITNYITQLLTIRKFNAKHFGIEDLIRVGTITDELAAILEKAVVGRQNILISGGTGTGKTTLLTILAQFIPAPQRILVIEDTAEIQISAPNLVRFEARVAQNGFPAVTVRELLKASLRHRPDRILLGEIRGAEAFDLLQLLNTGHSGTLSTVHANSALQAINRFTSCVLQSNVELPYRAIKSNIADSLNLLVHIERRPGHDSSPRFWRSSDTTPTLTATNSSNYLHERRTINENANTKHSHPLGCHHCVNGRPAFPVRRDSPHRLPQKLSCRIFSSAIGYDARGTPQLGSRARQPPKSRC